MMLLLVNDLVFEVGVLVCVNCALRFEILRGARGREGRKGEGVSAPLQTQLRYMTPS